MANSNPKVVISDQQPNGAQRAFNFEEQNDPILMVLRIAERLTIISGGLVEAVDNGEAYEALVCRIHALNGNLENLAKLASGALADILPNVSGLPSMQKDVRKPDKNSIGLGK